MTSKPLLLAILAGIALAAAAPGQQWRSALYPANWKPGYSDSAGRFLHDFSYAGYHRGEKAIPTVIPGVRVDVTQAPYNADASGAQDATVALQAAIDSVGARGGGVVWLPAGTYRLSFPANRRVNAALWVHDDGVVVRGAGAGQTRLFLDERVTRSTALIRFSPTVNGHWYRAVGASVSLTRDLPNQTTVVPVPNASAFQVGEWVCLRCDMTDAFAGDHGMRGQWNASLGGTVFYRKIVARSTSQQTITIDAPTRYPMRTRDGLRIYRVADPIDEAALEDLSVGMRQHPGPGFGDSDYTKPGTGAYEVHASDAILFGHARNCWIQRVTTYRPTTNRSNVHIHSDGIVLTHACQVTVKDCTMSRPQYEGGGGNGYGYVLQCADSLFVDCAGVHTRHNFSFKSLRTTGNVLLRCRSTTPRLALDFHMHLTAANLLDGTVLDADFIHASYRTSGTVVHGHATTQSVLWNTRGLRYGSRNYIIDSRQFGHGYVIGTQGAATAVVTTPTTVSGKNTAPRDWLEGVGRAATLDPPSLYTDQLRRRLGGGGTPGRYLTLGTGCGPAPTPSLNPLNNLRPTIGQTFSVTVNDVTGAATGLLGFSKSTWNGQRLPVDLSSLGMTGCRLFISADIPLRVLPWTPGRGLWSFPIPQSQSLVGKSFFQQAAVLAPRANPLGVVLSHAAEAVIGDR